MDPAKETGVGFQAPWSGRPLTSLLQFRFLGDPSGEFTKTLDAGFDASAIFGGFRSKRYALIVKDGEVAQAFVEPDNTGTKESMADNVLGK